MTTPSDTASPTGATRWLAEAARLLDRLAATQGDSIETASAWCADAIGADGLGDRPPVTSSREIRTRRAAGR